MSQYFPKPCKSFEENINVVLDFPSYATKAYLKNSTGVHKSKLAAKSDLASLKAELDQINVEKLKTVSKDLSKLSNVVNNDVVKETVYVVAFFYIWQKCILKISKKSVFLLSINYS